MNTQLQFWFICSDCWHFHGLLLKTWLTCRKSTMFVQSLGSLSPLHTHILPSVRGALVMSASPIIWQHLQRTDPSANTMGFKKPAARIWVTPECSPEPLAATVLLLSPGNGENTWPCCSGNTNIHIAVHWHPLPIIMNFLTAGLLILDKSIGLK